MSLGGRQGAQGLVVLRTVPRRNARTFSFWQWGVRPRLRFKHWYRDFWTGADVTSMMPHRKL
eukprot:491518-Hanusia_phi.AAC.1